jgi:hypothetical protein
VEKRARFDGTIMQPARVCDLAGELAGEAKSGGGHFDPATNSVFGRNSMKGGIHFNCREIVGVKFQPARLR